MKRANRRKWKLHNIAVLRCPNDKIPFSGFGGSPQQLLEDAATSWSLSMSTWRSI